MTRFNNRDTKKIIKKIHLLLNNVKAGEKVIEYLRSTEPIFMKEVGQFVTIELDKLKEEFDEEFLLYIGSIIGAAYIMGFLIAREIDHKIYEGLIDLDSLFSNVDVDTDEIDKVIDKGLEKGKKPNEISKDIAKFLSSPKKKKKKPIAKKKKKKTKRLDVKFDEGEL